MKTKEQKQRATLKASFDYVIKRADDRAHARRLTKLRNRMMNGTCTPVDALIGWVDITLSVKQ